jgi:beta-lactamase regulating signal transducer with metallopeptidase domain
MKHTVRLGPGRFVHLDSYKSYNETRLSKIWVAALALFIAALTVGALVGMDITNPTPTKHENTRSTDR